MTDTSDPSPGSGTTTTGPAHDTTHRLLERARNLVWVGVALAGLIMIIGGAYAVYRGMDARDEVESQLDVQKIVTPEDASIPNEPVDDVATAKSMAEIIAQHASESTGGLTYSEMGRFVSADDPDDPAGTNEAADALTNDSGQPVPNQARNTAFQASALQTSLYTSVMAFEVSTLVTGLGLGFIGLGLATWLVGVPLVWTVTRTVR